jgi:hypothetical protein
MELCKKKLNATVNCDVIKLVSVAFRKMLFLFIISSLFLPHPVLHVITWAIASFICYVTYILCNALRYWTLHYHKLSVVSLRYWTLHYHKLSVVSLRYCTLHYHKLSVVSLRYWTLHYHKLSAVSLRYWTLHYHKLCLSAQRLSERPVIL